MKLLPIITSDADTTRLQHLLMFITKLAAKSECSPCGPTLIIHRVRDRYQYELTASGVHEVEI